MTTPSLEMTSDLMFQPENQEQQLVRLSQRGDQEAFASLYDTYLERIYRYIYFRVADAEIAEDITSQVFLKAWEKLGSFQVGSSPFVAWLYRIAHNAVIDYYRTRRASVPLDDVSPVEVRHDDAVDERLDRQLESAQLRTALKTLTSEQQQVLILKFINGLSTLEIAKRLGKQQGAVRALQMRALQGLAKCPQFNRKARYEQ